ncbi:MAG TPA: methyltransferase domain-containing protein [Anaerolineales bacterium]|nr:methyltransferase domain-containing protein [Anaerolineales bacterium]
MDVEQDSGYFHELQTKTGWGRMLESFSRWCAPQPGSLSLDIGCGPGLLLALFARAGAVAFGCDHDPAMFASPLHPTLLAADGARLPFPSESFDLVTASNVLFLHPQPKNLLEEMARVVRPTGTVCLLNPSERMTVAAALALADEHNLKGLARETLVNYAQRAEAHFRWDLETLAGMYAQAGLEMTETAARMGAGLVRYSKGVKSNEG